MEHYMEKILWQRDAHYSNHRIPGMLVTSRGTLLAYREARQTMSDWARMDILLSRSEDCGETFQPDAVLAEGTETHPTVNNPVMAEDQTGRIHFLYCEDYGVEGGRVLHRTSDDDGVTWSAPEDISAATAPEYRNVFAFGPGHGICLKNGTLLFPVWLVPKSAGNRPKAHGPSEITTLYSTDNGASWHLGDLLRHSADTPSPNETTAAERADGSVYLNIRVTSGRGCRAQAVSANGYDNWGNYRAVEALPDPSCFGSVSAYHDGRHPHALIFGNCAHTSQRKMVTVRMSFDGGETFPVQKLLCADHGGYVETAADNRNGWIYVLYEKNLGETDTLVRMRYEDIING
jgi:sialidase-1